MSCLLCVFQTVFKHHLPFFFFFLPLPLSLGIWTREPLNKLRHVCKNHSELQKIEIHSPLLHYRTEAVIVSVFLSHLFLHRILVSITVGSLNRYGIRASVIFLYVLFFLLRFVCCLFNLIKENCPLTGNKKKKKRKKGECIFAAVSTCVHLFHRHKTYTSVPQSQKYRTWTLHPFRVLTFACLLFSIKMNYRIALGSRDMECLLWCYPEALSQWVGEGNRVPWIFLVSRRSDS